MTGGEGSLSRGAAKSAAAATATAPQGPLKRYGTKRKAKKEAPATVPHGGSSKGSSTKRKAAKDPASRRMPLPRATRRKAKDVDEAAAAAAVVAPAEEKYRQLSKADVRWILSLKPMEPPARFAALKRSNPELTPQPGEEADEDKRRLYRMAKALKKGYVELDEESAKRRAEVQAVIDREWPAIEEKMKSLILFEKECQGGDASDSDEGEDEEEDVSDSDEGEEEEDDKVKYKWYSGSNEAHSLTYN